MRLSVIAPRSIMRRKIGRMVGLPPLILPAFPWLMELINEEGWPKREWNNGRLILRWNETEVSWPE